MYRVESLSHTADVGFEVTADSPEELFRGAADGLARALRADAEPSDSAGTTLPRVGLPAEPADEERTEGEERPEGEAEPGRGTVEQIAVDRPDRERLLVGWLREILHRITVEGRFPAAVSVAFTGPTALRADVQWEPEARPEDLAREIKGVTYHGLAVERGDGGDWHARLVLDV